MKINCNTRKCILEPEKYNNKRIRFLYKILKFNKMYFYPLRQNPPNSVKPFPVDQK